MTDKLDLLMQERGLNKSELAREAGIPYMTIVNFYAKGTENVKRSTLLKLSAYFEVTVDYLAIDDETRRQHPVSRPLATEIADAPESSTKPRINPVIKGTLLDKCNILCYDELPPNVHCDFTLLFYDDSMEKIGVHEGDIVFIRAQEDVDNHEIAAVLIDNKLSIRRIYKNDTQLVLMAENTSYAPTVVTTRSNVRIVGKAVSYINPDIYQK
ncbi:MAG: S24 family peptidase [Clostridia bacterium]